jgi:hypothetical protein
MKTERVKDASDENRAQISSLSPSSRQKGRFRSANATKYVLDCRLKRLDSFTARDQKIKSRSSSFRDDSYISNRFIVRRQRVRDAFGKSDALVLE